jgi:hydroxypyruvate reductase
MPRTPAQLRADVERIWWAGVHAVLPDRLIPEHVQVTGHTLLVGDDEVDLTKIRHIAVVGAGKASAGMAIALERALGPRLLAEKQVRGWVNVPADCVVPTDRIHLHPARPAGVNEPRPEGVVGTNEILKIVSSLGPADLCFCLISGGGSALLPAPAPGISLDDKIRVTRALSAAGANIEQLNTVRRTLSMVKGGGLARACRAGRLISLIISDVLRGPLDLIASGPTVENSSSPQDALSVLKEMQLADRRDLASIVQFLQRQEQTNGPSTPTARVTNLIVGNNAVAVDAAGCEAERLGYSHAMISSRQSEGAAEGVGVQLAEMALRMRNEPGPDCLISGGEPTVALAEESTRGQGGRNQQLALAALSKLEDCDGIALLSAGTDGEDGPTEAAGALVTPEIAATARAQQLNAGDYLHRTDAYHFFQAAGGLFKTGPTHTNVCDLRVIVVGRTQSHHH